MATIDELEERLNALYDAVWQMAENNTSQTEKVDNTANKVVEITPYTETKTAYIGDTEVVFTNVPQGNLSVYFDTPTDYAINRESNNIEVSFEPLEEVTTVTISIIQ